MDTYIHPFLCWISLVSCSSIFFFLRLIDIICLMCDPPYPLSLKWEPFLTCISWIDNVRLDPWRKGGYCCFFIEVGLLHIICGSVLWCISYIYCKLWVIFIFARLGEEIMVSSWPCDDIRISYRSFMALACKWAFISCVHKHSTNLVCNWKGSSKTRACLVNSNLDSRYLGELESWFVVPRRI